MLRIIPTATIPTNKEVPPNETNGNGIPVTGRTPITVPTLMNACSKNHIEIPVASNDPNLSSHLSAARMPKAARPINNIRTVIAPTKPISSAITV